MKKLIPEEAPTCNVCGKPLWYDRTLEDGNEEWVCPNRWTGPDLLKWKPKDPEWEKHAVVIRTPKQKSLENTVNSPETLRVNEYLEQVLPSLSKPK